MTEKDLKKLNRYQLLELLIAQTTRADQLQAKLDAAEKQLAAQELQISSLGSIAEASLHLKGVFQSAQDAADLYLAYDNSLVIGGADHPTQFGFCAEIQHGTAISVTDMAGAQFSYTVSRIDRAKHAETSWLQSGEYDLSLFCRDTYSLEYIVVRCISANT